MLYAIKLRKDTYLSLVNSQEERDLNGDSRLLDKVFNDYNKAMSTIQLMLGDSIYALSEEEVGEQQYFLDDDFQYEFYTWETNNFNLEEIYDFVDDTPIITEDSFNG